jgi:DNA-binding NtrC family response regulator
MSSSILIVDDEPKFCETLARMLTRHGDRAEACSDPLKALERLRHQPFDVLLTDLKMPGMSGIDMIAEAKRLNPNMDVVMMTAFATAETAIEAMKLGALDYLIKPCSMADIRRILESAEATRQQRRDDDEPDPQIDSLTAAPESPGTQQSPSATTTPHRRGLSTDPVARAESMIQLMARATKVAQTQASVLISGESGTGKEILARHIHVRSKRARKPLIIVNCGAIPESLIESELFGHVRGAFTGAVESRRGYFEAADQGTLFLDEIGELPLHLQVKLLRALQDGHIQRVGESKAIRVDVRVLAATNRNLEQAVAAGAFRQDLYFRLNVIPLHLPPLRERPADIEALSDYFLARFTLGLKHPLRLSAETRLLLLQYDYPGNVRELENAIEHASVMAEHGIIQPGDLPERILHFRGRTAPPPAIGPSQFSSAPAPMNPTAMQSDGAVPSSHPQSTLEATERKLILDALAAQRYNLSRAAEALGITRRTLGYRIRKHALDQAVEEGKAREFTRRSPS